MLFTEKPRFILISAILAGSLFLTFCSGSTDREATEPVDAPEIIIPPFLTGDDSADKLYLRDYSNALHALFMISGNIRASELGSNNFRPELINSRKEIAENWLNLVQLTDSFFNNDGRFTHSFRKATDGWLADGTVSLADYPHLVYSYHMHHRSNRFRDDGLYERLNYAPLNYLVSPGRYLLDNHYRGGRFYNDDGRFDHHSMSYGLGGIHGHFYAWIIWNKPDGSDNMGAVSRERLQEWMGYSPEDLVEIALETALVLDNAWDSELQTYSFRRDGRTVTGISPSSSALSEAAPDRRQAVWNLDAIGAMMRGHKALYEILYIFGDDDEARRTARRLFDRSVAMFDQVYPLTRTTGLPQQIRFTSNGARAESEVADVYDTFQFLNHITGGFSWDRELEGTSGFIRQHRTDIPQKVGEMSDTLLRGALGSMLNESGQLVSTLNYETGEIVDERTSVSASGMFIAAAGNAYLKGNSFARAQDWPNATPEIRNRSRQLYELKMKHFDLIYARIKN